MNVLIAGVDIHVNVATAVRVATYMHKLLTTQLHHCHISSVLICATTTADIICSSHIHPVTPHSCAHLATQQAARLVLPVLPCLGVTQPQQPTDHAGLSGSVCMDGHGMALHNRHWDLQHQHLCRLFGQRCERSGCITQLMMLG